MQMDDLRVGFSKRKTRACFFPRASGWNKNRYCYYCRLLGFIVAVADLAERWERPVAEASTRSATEKVYMLRGLSQPSAQRIVQSPTRVTGKVGVK